MKFKELKTIGNQQTAEIVAGMLRNHGIETMIMNSPFNAVIPAPNIYGGYTLYVPETQFEESIRLLEEFGDSDL